MHRKFTRALSAQQGTFMLILSRKIDESILLGNDIRIKVVSIEKGVVKLGIDAPNNISILREELKIAVENANKEAATVTDEATLEALFSQFKPK
jgi:carbon storage regulator